jgi:hypothetical protein
MNYVIRAWTQKTSFQELFLKMRNSRRTLPRKGEELKAGILYNFTLLNGKIVKLAGDSSLHYVLLRMTDNCVFEDGVVVSSAANYPILS